MPEPLSVGAVASDGAVYTGVFDGLLLDVDRGEWIERPGLPGYEQGDERSVLTAGTDALVVGGVRWSNGSSPDDPTVGPPPVTEPELLTDAWIWRPGR
ncbi:MAG: hypothetical protein ACR2JF_02850 [Iamia sp.]